MIIKLKIEGQTIYRKPHAVKLQNLNQNSTLISLVSLIGLQDGIEWSLRAFASMRAVRLLLRARAVINFVMRAASTSEITNGDQRALRKFSASWNLSL